MYVVARPGLDRQFVTWLESLGDAERVINSQDAKVYRLRRIESGAPLPELLPLPEAGEPPLTIEAN